MDRDLDNVHGLKTFDSGEEEEVRQKAYKLCREFLNGAWRQVSMDEFVIKKVGGGLSNLLYLCALPPGVAPLGNEPPRALLRIYGPAHDGENVLEAHFSECVVFTMLSENENGPRLYGIFPGGRLEQYIPGRPLMTDELMTEEVSPLTAQAFAQIHAMSVPLSKEPKYLWTTLYRWVGQIEEYLGQAVVSDLNEAVVSDLNEAVVSDLNEAVVSDLNEAMVQSLRDLDLRAEVTWLKSFLARVRSPVVFCHNDLQEGNILLLQDKAHRKSVVLIDFEYCAYNYRAYDLANHMCETMYDYSNEQFPYFWYKPDNFPSRAKQARFVESYLCKYLGQESVSGEEVDAVIEEVNAFILASHLFWTVWSVVNASSSTITFDYWGWGASRLSAYQGHKASLLQPDHSPASPASSRCSLSVDNALATPPIPTS